MTYLRETKGVRGYVFKHLKATIIQHIKLNIALYLVIIFALLTGIASGSFTAGAMTQVQRTGLGGYLQNFFQVTLDQSINKGAIFIESFWQHLQITFFIWLSGLFFFGIPFVLIFVGIRSFFIGFTIGFLISQYNFGGFLFTLICILPQTLIYIPCIIGIGVLALEYSLKKFNTRKINYSKEQRMRSITPYTAKILILFIILSFGSVVEAFITPIFFGMFKWVFR